MADEGFEQTQSSSWCATCGHEFEDGDRYIEDTSSGFLGKGADPSVDASRQPPEAEDPHEQRAHTEHLGDALQERLEQAVSETEKEPV